MDLQTSKKENDEKLISWESSLLYITLPPDEIYKQWAFFYLIWKIYDKVVQNLILILTFSGTGGFWSHDILKHPNVVARAVRNKVSPTVLASITEGLIQATGGDPSKVDLSYTTAYRNQKIALEEVTLI